MINALHLFWIVPLAGTVGFLTCAILTIGSAAEHDVDDWR